MKKLLYRNRKGFTLTELIIVVTILGILAVLVTPLVSNMVEQAQNNSDAANAALLENAVARALARAPITGTGIYLTGGVIKASNDDAAAERADIRAAINEEVDEIPTCKTETWEFYVQLSGTGAGKVVAAATAPDVTWTQLAEDADVVA